MAAQRAARRAARRVAREAGAAGTAAGSVVALEVEAVAAEAGTAAGSVADLEVEAVAAEAGAEALEAGEVALEAEAAALAAVAGPRKLMLWRPSREAATEAAARAKALGPYQAGMVTAARVMIQIVREMGSWNVREMGIGKRSRSARLPSNRQGSRKRSPSNRHCLRSNRKSPPGNRCSSAGGKAAMFCYSREC